jgi:UDP-N-acetylglucosamine/UDP-N-acetylgalactosamine 4-epimerase
MNAFDQLKQSLRQQPRRWLVTGASGFIGSNLVEALLKLDQTVVGLDNLTTGRRCNLEQTRASVGEAQWERFRFIEGDIREPKHCAEACAGADHVLHQAALGSVPRSIADPATSHASNVTGFLNMLVAARDAKAQSFVYASSSSVYGDHPALPKVEENIGRCLSPYAATKRANEIYADVFGRCYGLRTFGLRYFNVFGPRQDPDGPYAAVMPKWVAAMLRQQPVFINGDGETSRDFCYIANVVQVNLLAALSQNPDAAGQVFNVAVHARTTLNQLLEMLRSRLEKNQPALRDFKPAYRDFRAGDVRHSHADITRAKKLLGYEPTHTIEQGIAEALAWYVEDFEASNAATR